MSRSSDRGVSEPLAALVAVAAVCTSLSIYAGLAVDALPSSGPNPGATLGVVTDEVAPEGVAHPERLSDVSRPQSARLNASLTVGGLRWTTGPTPPSHGASANRRLPVRVRATTVRPGELRVVVW